MVQRAIAWQQCKVCGTGTRSRLEMAGHVKEHHGEGTPGRYPPGFLTRAKDQMEFKPCLSQTPWGGELR